MSFSFLQKHFVLPLMLMTSFTGISQNLPIFTEKLKAGVYETFEEFKFNTPSITDSLYFEIEQRQTKNWNETFSVTARYVDTKKKVKKAWGFSDGKKAYCYHEFEYFEIDLSNGKCTFYGYGSVNNNAVAAGAAVAGLIGAGITQAAAVASAKNKRIRYHIDQADGTIEQIVFVAHDKVVEQPDVYIVFYRYGKKESSEKIQITVNDTLNIDFDNFSYDQLKFKVSREPVKIEYGDAILYVDIKNEDNKYVEVSDDLAGKKEKLVLWDYVTGDFYAKKAKKRQLAREK